MLCNRGLRSAVCVWMLFSRWRLLGTRLSESLRAPKKKKFLKMPKSFTPQHQYAWSPYCSINIFKGIYIENFLNSQDISFWIFCSFSFTKMQTSVTKRPISAHPSKTKTKKSCIGSVPMFWSCDYFLYSRVRRNQMPVILKRINLFCIFLAVAFFQDLFAISFFVLFRIFS